jgi:hypothetical protein
VGSETFGGQIIWGATISEGQKMLRVQNILGSNNCACPIIFGVNKFWGHNFFGIQKFVGVKKMEKNWAKHF